MTANVKECGHHHDDRRVFYQRIFAGLLTLIIIILLIILLIWLILRPTKPSFILQDATVYAFNVTQPNLLTTTFQVTVSTRNPNDRIGVYYEKLDVYAAYRNQQITLPTLLPPTYQGHKDTVVWSPFLYGNSVPVAPYLTLSLSEDQNAGLVLVNIKIDGRVKWKVGTWISGRYHLWVNCPAYITFGSRNNGIRVGPAIKYQLATSCEVDI
ncbi:hypothetical protein Nepgr_000257 [Nepenthes gracilis]|uniref:Late embryogenesis abundant protein LEA-2 subgroup domain-containing protein n=1 Tax=Nepenthes gracilis TaxID=150966 RepID=A0AAD3P4Y9_NEPGR|nr:hypothetical protein Nepgr_000257 [Nepenthes gracilis]